MSTITHSLTLDSTNGCSLHGMDETLERLVGGPSLRELAGTLSDEEAATFREAIEASHEQHDASGMFDG